MKMRIKITYIPKTEWITYYSWLWKEKEDADEENVEDDRYIEGITIEDDQYVKGLTMDDDRYIEDITMEDDQYIGA